jgi:hypothetical protein
MSTPSARNLGSQSAQLSADLLGFFHICERINDAKQRAYSPIFSLLCNSQEIKAAQYVQWKNLYAASSAEEDTSINLNADPHIFHFR